MIKVERIYNNPRGNSTFRILVDRLWPRGLRKDKVKVDLWQKDIAPSNSLRRWFSHDESKWDEFKHRYFKELEKNAEFVNTIIDRAKEEPITLLYGAKEEKFNNAMALKEYLEEKIKVAKENGADEIVSPEDGDPAKRVMEITGNLGADAIIDFVNGSKTVETDMKMLRRRGRVVLVGLFGGELKLSLVSMPTRAYRLIGSYTGSLSDLLELVSLAKRGIIKPVVSNRFKLS